MLAELGRADNIEEEHGGLLQLSFGAARCRSLRLGAKGANSRINCRVTEERAL
jgi:hypothetical protein